MSTAVVTGASNGLGRALSEGLARRGWSLIVNGRDPALLEQAQGRLWKLDSSCTTSRRSCEKRSAIPLKI